MCDWRFARRNEQRDMGPYFRHVARERMATHLAGHMDVSEEEVDYGRSRSKVTQGFFRMLRFHHLKSCVAHRVRDQKPDEGFVFG